MGLRLNGVDIERIYVNGIECDSVWLNGIQIVVPPIEVGNQAVNGGARFRRYHREGGAQVGTSVSLPSSFETYIGVVAAIFRYHSSDEYTRPSVSLYRSHVRERLINFTNQPTRQSTQAMLMDAGICTGSAVSANASSGVSPDRMVFTALMLSLVGVNHANHIECAGGIYSGGGYQTGGNLQVQPGDLVLAYSSSSAFRQSPRGIAIKHGLIVERNPASDAYQPVLWEVTKGGEISITSGNTAAVLIVIGKR